jgi:uncharacterized protein YjbI with pentapeptide repeats
MNTDLTWRLGQHRLYLSTLDAPERQGELIGGEDLDFRGVPLEGAWLDWAVVPGSDFTGARLVGAGMSRGNFASCRFVRADLSGARLYKSTAVYADFTDAVLRRADLCRVDLSDAILCDATLDGADLSRATLDDADLRGASLRGSTLAQVTFRRVRVARLDLRDAVGFAESREHEIDVSPTNQPEILTGQAARMWLLHRIHAEVKAA